MPLTPSISEGIRIWLINVQYAICYFTIIPNNFMKGAVAHLSRFATKLLNANFMFFNRSLDGKNSNCDILHFNSLCRCDGSFYKGATCFLTQNQEFAPLDLHFVIPGGCKKECFAHSSRVGTFRNSYCLFRWFPSHSNTVGN
jgi:hypothetical protein